jgi:primosomal protein N' (replication factor Y)
MPPFGKLASLIISAEDRASAMTHAQNMMKAAPTGSKLELLGPADAPMAVIRGRHRVRLLLHADKSMNVQAYLRRWLAAAPRPKGSIRMTVDVDPTTFY